MFLEIVLKYSVWLNIVTFNHCLKQQMKHSGLRSGHADTHSSTHVSEDTAGEDIVSFSS